MWIEKNGSSVVVEVFYRCPLYLLVEGAVEFNYVLTDFMPL
jgi:hypothetical protein